MVDIVVTISTTGGTAMALTTGAMVTITAIGTATVGSALAHSVLESP
jgi:hypothetical protein